MMQATTHIQKQGSVATGAVRHPSMDDSSGTVQSTELFQGKKSVAIEHNGAIYRLQMTKLGKLILTK